MGALIVLTAALAAQTAAASGTGNGLASEKQSTGPKVGQSTYLDLEAGAGYSSNPQTQLGSNTGGGFGRISLHAVHSRVSERSTTLLSAYAENMTYTNHYHSQQSLSFYGRHDAAVSEHLRIFGDLNASYQEGGQLDTRILVLPDVPPLPGLPGEPILLPPGTDFLTVRGREYQLSAHAGAQVSRSTRDSLHVSSGVDRTIFHGGFARTSYTTIPVSIGYDRQLNERTTIGGQVVAEDTEYSGPASVRMITPQLTARFLLSPTLSLSGAAGVSFAKIDDGTTTRHTTGLAANASLCSNTERGFLCGHFSIDQEAATAAGPTKSISAGVQYSRKLDVDSSIALAIDGNRYSTPFSVVTNQSFSHATYFRASAEYSRKIGRRFFGGVDLSARKVTEAGPDPKADVSGSVFIRYRLGDLQ